MLVPVIACADKRVEKQTNAQSARRAENALVRSQVSTCEELRGTRKRAQRFLRTCTPIKYSRGSCSAYAMHMHGSRRSLSSSLASAHQIARLAAVADGDVRARLSGGGRAGVCLRTRGRDAANVWARCRERVA
eukprot:6207498-Pleurochrysis_carterae.AAC.2